jgi:hypothetical protein
VIAFLDFEASSLDRHGTPIEVAWVFEDGAEETHLIRPAPGWTDWDHKAEAVHHIPPETLRNEGAGHEAVAGRMVEVLTGHALFASAPSWDGKWLSILLRSAGFSRHALRVRDSDEAFAEAIRSNHSDRGLEVPTPEQIAARVAAAKATDRSRPPAHRALPDARREWQIWRALRDGATPAV